MIRKVINTRIGWFRKPSIMLALCLAILVMMAFPIQAITTGSTVKKTTVSPLQGGINPYRQSLASTHSGPNAGWRVPRGKIGDLGYHPGKRPDPFSKETMLPGLSGFVRESSTLALRDKVTIKHTKIKPEGKYKSLVDALKEFDSQQKRRRR